MRMNKLCMVAAAAVTALGAATTAQAVSVLQFDVNTVTASINPVTTFDLNYTGTVTLSTNANTSLSEILIDGVDQGIASGQLGDFSGTITLDNGVVTGGGFTLMDISGATYSASVQSGSGGVNASAGQTGPFTIDGLTFMGAFANLSGGTDFAGVDVSLWDAATPNLSGSFLEFKFGPFDSNGMDNNTDIDIFVVIPLPAPAGMAMAGLVGLGCMRRRLS